MDDILSGIRDAMISGSSVRDLLPTLGALAIFAVVLVPGSLVAFTWAESYAKKTGKLKRQG